MAAARGGLRRRREDCVQMKLADAIAAMELQLQQQIQLLASADDNRSSKATASGQQAAAAAASSSAPKVQFPSFLQRSKSLYMLDLASNNFYRGLPMWIGELSKLQILRLSHNNFSASIPTTITNLGFLVYSQTVLDPATAAAVVLASAPPLLPRRPAAAGGNVTAAGCSTLERDALLAFKKGITADPAGVLASWNHDDCCRWRGVRCSDCTGHVVGLNLRNKHANQQELIDYEEFALVGEISHSLLNLHHLEHLDLSLNAIQGPSARVPKFLGSLKNLRYLNLSGIPFNDTVPPQLGNLTNLHYLDLSSEWIDTLARWFPTQMTSVDLSWLTRLRSLKYLNMHSTNLSMVQDWTHVVNNIPSLKVIRLANCELTYANQHLSHINLTNLEELDLSQNHFDHSIASCWFWNAKGLEYLNLRFTELYGRFPNALGHLKSLQVLDFKRIINIDIMTANMTNLCKLRILNIESSQVHGNIAEFIERLPQCSSTRLNELYLSNNNLTGILPNHLYPLTSLVILDMSLNELSGHVPSEMGMLSNLTYLDLSGNNLDGVITDEHFASLKSLKTLDLSGNSLTILVNITNLDMSFAGITDMFPDWFSTTFANLNRLDVSNNGINGSLPANMKGMASLSRLYLNSNNITGQIPVLPEGLNIMDLSRNSLSGPLPSNFGAFYLSDLRLFSNRITGQIPQSICELQNIDILDLADNLLVGEFPRCFQSDYISMLFLSNNMLSGKFPPCLQSMKVLYILDLSSNNFYGSLPKWIGELSKLEILRASHNNFSGSIPTTITNITGLVHLDFSRNSISGVLPFHLSNLTGMTSRSSPTTFGHYVPILNMSVDTKAHELYYQESVIFEVVTIDLSSNFLTGEIPKEIGFLDGVKNLNLSWNQFNGRIPSSIGLMRSLESLDLSKNNLSGEIPSSLSNLTYLSYLDVSYNHLTGRIPSGGQLDTLYSQNPSMYNGNSGLCGLPLHKDCSDGGNASVGKRSERDKEFLYFGLGSGFVVGLWVVFCTILFKRIAYFRLFDKLYDERRALLRSIKPLFTGEFGRHDSWNEATDCCTYWSGVVCGGDRRVVSLFLDQAGIAGAVDVGVFAPFTELQELDLSWNKITALAFPKLSKLSLSHNSMTDEGVAALFVNLTTLSELYLGGNQLFTSSWISNLTSLRAVDLSRNSLREFNGICNLHQLEYLQLGVNMLHGAINSCLGNLHQLKYLNMERNFLTGEITPNLLSNLTKLETIHLGLNNLTGTFMLSWLANSSNLAEIVLSHNYDLRIETEIVTWTPLFQLAYLNFSNCIVNRRSDGVVPTFLSTQLSISGIDLSGCSLQGKIPSWLFYNISDFILLNDNDMDLIDMDGLGGNMTSPVQVLDLSDNKISMSIPTNFGSIFQYLEYCDMSSNRVYGGIPPLAEATSLEGPCPPSIGVHRLEHLSLENNRFSGQLSPLLSKSSNLKTLNARSNHLSGIIPDGLLSFQKLGVILLGGNDLHGPIPLDLCFNNYLHFVDLSNNRFSGKIPDCFYNDFWTDLPMYFDDDPFSGIVTERMSVDFTTKGESLTYMGMPLVLMTGIDLSMNQLSGTIPPPVGFLRQLKSLNLSHNQLVGPIPETFMYMEDMESMDLSYNHLNGSLPMQLANLSFLCSFNVAYNNLSGEIPFQSQFETFDESAFEGNDNLCGEIINKTCSVLHQNQGGVLSDDAIDTALVFWSFVFGCFALGFWGTVAWLIWDKGRRKRLCSFMDALMYKLGWEFVP
uniref:non-specific serine/threonine protein kinase n=1 Tax=Leersia perrieri TaxID=77586 RepID=A0A0D9XTA0_9ORYZ